MERVSYILKTLTIPTQLAQGETSNLLLVGDRLAHDIPWGNPSHWSTGTSVLGIYSSETGFKFFVMQRLWIYQANPNRMSLVELCVGWRDLVANEASSIIVHLKSRLKMTAQRIGPGRIWTSVSMMYVVSRYLMRWPYRLVYWVYKLSLEGKMNSQLWIRSR